MSDKKTLVDEGTTFKGALTSSVPVHVNGAVDGELSAPSVTVAAGGSVSGKVKAAELVSEGTVAGELDVDKLRLSGAVKDDTLIRAKSIDVKLGPASFGDCILEVGEMTDEKSAGGASRNSAPPPADA